MKGLLLLIATASAAVLLASLSGCGGGCGFKGMPERIPPPVDEYFGAYRPGNWWVYANAEGTVRDSVYLTGFENFDSTYILTKNCPARLEVRRWLFASRILAPPPTRAQAEITGGTTGVFVRFGFNSFYYEPRTGEFSTGGGTDPGKKPIVKLPQVTLNGTTYLDVLVNSENLVFDLKSNDNYYFYAKKIGLVGWQTKTDTISLIKRQIF